MEDEVGAPAKIRGYTDKQSVLQGHSLHFCVANLNGTDLSRVPVSTVRLGRQETQVACGLAAACGRSIPVDRAWDNSWDVGYKLEVGHDWIPGVYAARIGRPSDDPADIFFVVRNAKPGATTPIVVQIPTTTINAYNNWGGASLYAYNSAPSPAVAVSFDRPQCSDPLWPGGHGFADEWNARMRAFVYWMEAAGYRADFITSNDLHEETGLLRHYQLFISIGHDEYWSREMRDNLDDFVASGGNVAVFGGNTCLWQIRLEPDEKTDAAGRRQVCYRDAGRDPVADPALKTATWRDAGYPENLSFGAGFAAGAWRGTGTPAPFKVHRPKHWAFHQTGLRQGDSFGAGEEALLRYETNSVDYQYNDRGLPVPTGADGTPPNYLILALAELPDWQIPGNAAMGVFTSPRSGGIVFNAATTDWARGLETCIRDSDPFRIIAAKITRNVIEHLTPAHFVCEAMAIDGGGTSHVYRPKSAHDLAISRLQVPAAFKAYTAPVDSDLVPIYRFQGGPYPKERLSRSALPRGWKADGIAFYAYAGPAGDRTAVYRIKRMDAVNGPHERYSSKPEAAHDERLAGVAFYAPE
jgi:hypothetical protein